MQNMEVERQLCTQEQLQQLATAAAVSSAAVAAAAATAQQQMLAGGLGTPPLAMAAAASPPNSQRKLLMHLTVSARPADAEVSGAWAPEGGWPEGLGRHRSSSVSEHR